MNDPLFLQLGLSLKKIIYLILAVMSLCHLWAFSSCSKQGLLFIAECELLAAVDSLVAEYSL